MLLVLVRSIHEADQIELNFGDGKLVVPTQITVDIAQLLRSVIVDVEAHGRSEVVVFV